LQESLFLPIESFGYPPGGLKFAEDFQKMHLRTMAKQDFPAGLRLKELAGWNQTPADWNRFLDASPEGCFVAEVDGKVCGTATTISFENKFAWIGMVLVDPEYRSRGIGTKLLERTIEYLDQRRMPTMKLDATTQGKPLYEKLGFVTEYGIERWVLKRPARADAEIADSSRASLSTAQLVSILNKDREVFGADRTSLLRSLDVETPHFTMGAWDSGMLQGYTFGRRGSFADHLGPWMANEATAACCLLDEFLARSSRETIVVDCLAANPVAVELLRTSGFSYARMLTRMYRGQNQYPGNPDALCAILGPEFG
jgi:GNAT superfamily N-acetyltransferase